MYVNTDEFPVVGITTTESPPSSTSCAKSKSSHFVPYPVIVEVPSNSTVPELKTDTPGHAYPKPVKKVEPPATMPPPPAPARTFSNVTDEVDASSTRCHMETLNDEVARRRATYDPDPGFWARFSVPPVLASPSARLIVPL
jgi:hypothetical protein